MSAKGAVTAYGGVTPLIAEVPFWVATHRPVQRIRTIPTSTAVSPINPMICA